MATGTGKTKLAIALLYRLLAAKRFRRICFVVDRSTLGNQAEGEFSTTKVVSGRTFAEIFGPKGLKVETGSAGASGASSGSVRPSVRWFVAKRLIEHLTLDGFVVLRLPPPAADRLGQGFEG